MLDQYSNVEYGQKVTLNINYQHESDRVQRDLKPTINENKTLDRTQAHSIDSCIIENILKFI